MTTEPFDEVKALSLEIRSLIKQGVREGVDEKIRLRNEKLKSWFSAVSRLEDMTPQQRSFMEDLLQEERVLVERLYAEQKGYANHQKGIRQAGKYQQMRDSHR